MRSKDIIKKLENDGWVEVNQKGSHKQFKHPEKSGRVTVPHPKKDIPKGTIKSIEKQSGITMLLVVKKKHAQQHNTKCRMSMGV